jgi:MFS family permease
MQTTTLAATDTENQTSWMARWYVLALMCAVYTLSITDRYMIQQVLEPIRLELHLTDTMVSFIGGVPLALFYVVLGFPISWLIDRSNRRNIIVASLVAWSLMTALCGWSRTALQLIGARIGGTPGANSILSDYFPALRRPMALTIFSLGAPIGAYFASATAGAIADHAGWRASFLYLGLPGVLVGLLIFFTVKEPTRGQQDRKPGDMKPTFWQTMVYLWSQRAAVHLMAASALTALWGWGLMFWTPTFLFRCYGLSPGEAGDITGPVNLYGGSMATLATAWLVGTPWMADPRRVVRLMGWVVGVATVASFFIYWTHSLAVVKALFWVFIPAIYFYIGPCFGLLLNLAEPRMRAMFCAATLFVANVGNLIIAPSGVGFLSDTFASATVTNAESLRLAMLCLVPTGLWATLHYFLTTRRIIADQERATGVRVQV